MPMRPGPTNIRCIRCCYKGKAIGDVPHPPCRFRYDQRLTPVCITSILCGRGDGKPDKIPLGLGRVKACHWGRGTETQSRLGLP